MSVFIPGQRWIGESEPELWLGTVVPAGSGRVKVEFKAAGETRVYADDQAPLKRAHFRAGDKIKTQADKEFVVTEVAEHQSLLTGEESCHGSDKVVELDKNFKAVWSYPINSPWAAIRLKNGNTLVTDEKDSLTREVNAGAKRSGNSRTATCRRLAGLSSRRRAAPGWPTSTRSSVRAATRENRRSSWKPPRTRKSSGFCRTGKTLAPHLRCKFWTILAFLKLPVNRNTDRRKLP